MIENMSNMIVGIWSFLYSLVFLEAILLYDPNEYSEFSSINIMLGYILGIILMIPIFIVCDILV